MINKLKKFLSIIFIVIVFSFVLSKTNSLSKEISPKGQLVVTQQLDKDIKKLAKELKDAYTHINSLKAKFYQQTWTSGSSQPILAQGSVWLKRPNLMRWQYDKPYKQLIIAGLRDVYIYQPEQHQVMVIPRNRFLTSQITNAFFTGDLGLSHFFYLKLPKNSKNSIILIPIRTEPQVKQIEITLDPKSHLIKEIWIKDQMGGNTHILFSNIIKNPKVSDKMFQFTPPKGVKIFNSPRD